MASSSCTFQCKQTVGMLLLLMCCSSQYAQARPKFIPSFLDAPYKKLLPFQHHRQAPSTDEEDKTVAVAQVQRAVEWEFEPVTGTRGEKFEVPTPALILPYHNGPLLTASTGISVYIIWYGTFTAAQKSIVTDFFASFTPSAAAHPSVSSWWSVTSGYKDSSGASVSQNVKLGGQTSVSYTLGTTLTESDVQTLVTNSLATFPTDSSALYLVLTASDVMVADFCMNSCGSHFATLPGAITNGKQLPYAWVGNPSGSASCESLCAWPYAKAAYGPPDAPLVAPNGDVGLDGMMINIGIILAGAATDPYTNGYYQGDASAPLESGSACQGIYGTGAYSGYPGNLLVDVSSKASYNVNGVNGRKYLMSALWDPSALACTPPS